MRAVVPIRHAAVRDTADLLRQLVPEVRITEQAGSLVLEGIPAAVDQVRELLVEFDQPVTQVLVQLRMIRGPAVVQRFPFVSTLALRPLHGHDPVPRCTCGVAMDSRDTQIVFEQRVATPLGGQAKLDVKAWVDARVDVHSWKDGVLEMDVRLQAGSQLLAQRVTAKEPSGLAGRLTARDGATFVITGPWDGVLLLSAHAMR